MGKNVGGPPQKGLWAYAYDFALPPKDERLDRIQELLDRAHAEAVEGARTWAGRVVVEPQVTRILVVADSPDADRDVNRRLEAKLKALKADFVVTAPMFVVDDDATQPGRPRSV